MTPFAPGTFIPELGLTLFGRHTLVILATMVVFGAIAVAGVIGYQAATSPAAAEARPAAGVAVDGWLAGIAAANRATALEDARQVHDGWSSYLLQAEPAAVDGWSSYLLRVEPDVTDGWATRYLGSDDD